MCVESIKPLIIGCKIFPKSKKQFIVAKQMLTNRICLLHKLKQPSTHHAITLENHNYTNTVNHFCFKCSSTAQQKQLPFVMLHPNTSQLEIYKFKTIPHILTIVGCQALINISQMRIFQTSETFGSVSKYNSKGKWQNFLSIRRCLAASSRSICPRLHFM